MKMPFEDEAFDAVYEIDATCHAPDQVRPPARMLHILLVTCPLCAAARRGGVCRARLGAWRMRPLRHLGGPVNNRTNLHTSVLKPPEPALKTRP
jgi:hypothetical protein